MSTYILVAIILTSCMSIYALASLRKRNRNLQEDLATSERNVFALAAHIAHVDELREQQVDEKLSKMAKDAVASWSPLGSGNA